MARKYLLEQMLPAEMEQALEALPVAVIPVGLIEWHGDHLPLGQDMLKSQALCAQLMEKLEGGIMTPPIYTCRPGFSRYTGTMTFSDGLVSQLFYELFGQLRKLGCRVILLLTGHYGPLQVDAVKRAAEGFQKEFPDTRVIARPEYEDVIVDGETPADHAGKWETSLFWHFYPELTHMENFSPTDMTLPLYDSPPNDYYKEGSLWQWPEDLSDPDVASPERGARAAAAITDHLAGLIRAALSELGPA